MSGRERRIAIGDPQAPIETVVGILRAHGLLGEDGRVARDVHLVVMGDYFDWGGPSDRTRAAESATRLLEWLASHSPEQVTLLIGNHDLARVGELAHFDDAAFRAAQVEADAAYLEKRPERALEAFVAATGLPSWELAARDFSTFEARQRDLVESLLRAGRLEIAHAAAPDLLLTHAGVTRSELATLGVDEGADAFAIARALGAATRAAVAAWTRGPFAIPGLHEPGDRGGEGRGMFYHRPEVRSGGRAPAPAALSRRYDVTSLPVGLGQAIGHIRDAKSRTLLGVAPRSAEEAEGALHHVEVHGTKVTYARGVPRAVEPDGATLLFLDGGMHHTDVARYEVYDLVHRGVARRDEA